MIRVWFGFFSFFISLTAAPPPSDSSRRQTAEKFIRLMKTPSRPPCGWPLCTVWVFVKIMSRSCHRGICRPAWVVFLCVWKSSCLCCRWSLWGVVNRPLHAATSALPLDTPRLQLNSACFCNDVGLVPNQPFLNNVVHFPWIEVVKKTSPACQPNHYNCRNTNDKNLHQFLSEKNPLNPVTRNHQHHRALTKNKPGHRGRRDLKVNNNIYNNNNGLDFPYAQSATLVSIIHSLFIHTSWW